MRSAAAGLAMLAAVLLTACHGLPYRNGATPAEVEYRPALYSQLPGWESDSLLQAWPALLASCRVNTRAGWSEVCAGAVLVAPVTEESVRTFITTHLRPLQVVRAHATRVVQDAGLLTGYYEPQLRGSRARVADYQTPLYSPPDDLLTVDLSAVVPELKGRRIRGRLLGKTVVPYYARAELANDKALQGHEIVWLDNALDAFSLEVQGSGRIQLTDGSIIRLGYADQNGQPYRAIGRYLVSQGALSVEQATMPGIRAWLAEHPQRLREVLDANPSVVFFQELPLGDPALGPRGAQGIALTPGRSIAVDPNFIALGTPVYLAAPEAKLARLVVAQDTGGAIAGAPRADYFVGTGEAAANLAGTLRAQATLWMLWPLTAPPPSPAQNSRQILPK